MQREKTLAVNIPAGVEDGTRIRLAGEGEAGMRGGPPGDLYIFVSVRPHRLFQRDGANLFCRVPIPMTHGGARRRRSRCRRSTAGARESPVPAGHPDRQAVPPARQGHDGAARATPAATCCVEVVVETPVNLTKRQQELLREFEEGRRDGEGARTPRAEGFFARVKEFWDELTD